jgi:hypothetical protein
LHSWGCDSRSALRSSSSSCATTSSVAAGARERVEERRSGPWRPARHPARFSWPWERSWSQSGAERRAQNRTARPARHMYGAPRPRLPTGNAPPTAVIYRPRESS